MKRRICSWLCALLVLTLGVALAEDGAETRKPYTVWQVCITVPVEWDESGHEISADYGEYYTFAFGEGDGAGSAWIGIMSEETAVTERNSPEAFAQVLEEFPEHSIEREVFHGRETLLFAFTADGEQWTGALFALDSGDVVTIAITCADEAQAKTLAREIVESAAIMDEE